MAEKRPALGRGLSALIPPARPATPPPGPAAPSTPDARAATPVVPRELSKPLEVDLDLLVPNPRQPRAQIDETRLDELAQSIRANGVIQPIVVRRAGERYEIVAGLPGPSAAWISIQYETWSDVIVQTSPAATSSIGASQRLVTLWRASA